jgi:succinate dehydrogenase / fumarate reductase, cytochrome b subunit
MSAVLEGRSPASSGPVVWSLSTIGAKAVVAITGLLLIFFLIAHLAGNLLLFKGPEALNAYAQFLKDQGSLLWVARIGLLGIFAIHLGMALLLAKRKYDARPQGYVYQRTLQASTASLYMLQTGIIILLFVLLHLAHYTLGLVGSVEGQSYHTLKDASGRHDVYRMVIAGFSNPFFAIFYIVCQIALGLHLYHGASSMFQTMGINYVKYNMLIQRFGLVVSIAIAGGNILIVAVVWLGLVR